MILYCIVRSKDNIQNPDTYRLLQEAAAHRSIEFVTLEADSLNYATIVDDIVDGSLLYRISAGSRSLLLEALISHKVTTLRKNLESLLAREFNWSAAIRLQQADLPIIPTIYNVDRKAEAHLESYVESLGGFPIVLKSAGGSHGSGVMRLDSIGSLRSVVDYASNGTSESVLRRYIANARHLRLVVLGGEVLDVIEYRSQKGDFRTNAVSVPEVFQPGDVRDEIRRDAVLAVDVLGFEFGGVDVLIDEDGNYFIAEVNFPCNFARNQMNTGVDIAGHMVDHLIQKSQA